MACPFTGNSQRMRLAAHSLARSDLGNSQKGGKGRRRRRKEKKNLRLRLCSNYTWHVNGGEGRQSRKLAAKEDRGEDQEWLGMSLNFTSSSVLPCSAYHWLCPTSHAFILFLYFFFRPPPAQPQSLTLSVHVLLSVDPFCLWPVNISIHTNGKETLITVIIQQIQWMCYFPPFSVTLSESRARDNWH